MGVLKILHVVGARPNYMKIAPVMAEMGRYTDEFEQVLVHTGQHFDYKMAQVFFEDLKMRRSDDYLGVGSGTHAGQTARIMLAFEPLVPKHKPDLVVVVGDVNSTLACALVCAKLGVRVAHIEAGLRSRDWSMPEEINRVLTDRIATFLFTPSRDSNQNLVQEGIPPNKIYFVGNVMIDTLIQMLPRTESCTMLSSLELAPKSYVLVTLHRPGNVDGSARLRQIMSGLGDISQRWPVVFPVHPRTRREVARLGLGSFDSRMRLLEPLGYVDFLTLMRSAGVVITDSGGVQEETTYLGIPCLTIRPNTERPVTIEIGTNELVSGEPDLLMRAVESIMQGYWKVGQIPDLWDGLSAKRIVSALRALK